MNKMMKLMMIGALVAQVGVSWGMEQCPLTLQNKSGETLDVIWISRAPRGYTGSKKVSSIKLQHNQQINLLPVDQIVQISFSTSGGIPTVWNESDITGRSDSSDNLLIRSADLLEQGEPAAVEEESEIAQGGFLGAEVEQPETLAALSYFPALKDRLVGKLGDALAIMSIDQVEEYIRQSKSGYYASRFLPNVVSVTVPITVRDFFPDLPRNYTVEDLKLKIYVLESRLRELWNEFKVAPDKYPMANEVIKRVQRLIALVWELDKAKRNK